MRGIYSVRSHGPVMAVRGQMTQDQHDEKMLELNTRLNAVPPNPLKRGDMGTLWDGDNNGEPSPGAADVDTIWESFANGISSLSPDDQEKIKQLMSEYGAGTTATTTGAGVATVDRQLTTADTNRRTADHAAAAIRSMQRANNSAWDKINADHDRHVHGHARR
jgi:hypothetical protein